jgi:transcriptional regulator with XRE-family HTH domain
MITGEQLRAARAMLKMEQGELAELSGVSIETIKRLERMEGQLNAQVTTLYSLQKTLEGEGVIFLPENGNLAGLQLRRDPPPAIRTRKKRGARHRHDLQALPACAWQLRRVAGWSDYRQLGPKRRSPSCHMDSGASGKPPALEKACPLHGDGAHVQQPRGSTEVAWRRRNP